MDMYFLVGGIVWRGFAGFMGWLLILIPSMILLQTDPSLGDFASLPRAMQNVGVLLALLPPVGYGLATLLFIEKMKPLAMWSALQILWHLFLVVLLLAVMTTGNSLWFDSEQKITMILFGVVLPTALLLFTVRELLVSQKWPTDGQAIVVLFNGLTAVMMFFFGLEPAKVVGFLAVLSLAWPLYETTNIF